MIQCLSIGSLKNGLKESTTGGRRGHNTGGRRGHNTGGRDAGQDEILQRLHVISHGDKRGLNFLERVLNDGWSLRVLNNGLESTRSGHCRRNSDDNAHPRSSKPSIAQKLRFASRSFDTIGALMILLHANTALKLGRNQSLGNS